MAGLPFIRKGSDFAGLQDLRLNLIGSIAGYRRERADRQDLETGSWAVLLSAPWSGNSNSKGNSYSDSEIIVTSAEACTEPLSRLPAGQQKLSDDTPRRIGRWRR